MTAGELAPLTGSTVLVTGATGGYGRAVAAALAQAGARVGVLGRDVARVSAVAREVDGVPVVADVLDADAVTSSVDAFAAVGGLDVLVNNAGVGGPLGLAWETDPDDWWRTLEVNVRGSHLLCRAAIPHLIESGRGRILNVVSHAGTARWPFGSAYAVSKAALIKLGENLATELARHGVLVANFHPGIMEIGLTGNLLSSDVEPGSPEARVARWFRDELAAGNGIDAAASAAQLVRLVAELPASASGTYVTAYDDLDAVTQGRATVTLGLVRAETT